MRGIVLFTIKYLVIIFIINLSFGVIYSLKNDWSIFQCLRFSFIMFLDFSAVNIENIDGVNFLLLVHKFINNFSFALFPAFIFEFLINPVPSVIFPSKILLRKRTSYNCKDIIALMITIRNKHGKNKKYIYDVTAKLTYSYQDENNANNSNTQLSYHVHLIKNFNSFYYDINSFPKHFFELFKEPCEVAHGHIHITLSGKYGSSLHEFILEKTYSTSDILIASSISPYNDEVTLYSKEDKNMIINYINNSSKN